MDGVWTTWTEWGECSTTCEAGRRRRSRSCTEPAPARGGKNCDGDFEEFKYCWLKWCPGRNIVDYTIIKIKIIN